MSDVSERALASEEGLDSEFKSSLSGLDAEDLVAFANSSAGGVILIGVEEEAGPDGRKIPRIVGTRIGDEAKLKILNKAHDCVPPIDVKVQFENVASSPIIRIDVPPAARPPHCTKRGVYKIREDGKTRGLQPEELLQLFLAHETDEFVTRFRTATAELVGSVESLKSQIEMDLHRLREEIGTVAEDLRAGFMEIFGEAENASSHSEEAMMSSDLILGHMEEVLTGLKSISDRVAILWENQELLLDEAGIEQPMYSRMREWLKERVADRAPIDGKEASDLARLCQEDFLWIPLSDMLVEIRRLVE